MSFNISKFTQRRMRFIACRKSLNDATLYTSPQPMPIQSDRLTEKLMTPRAHIFAISQSGNEPNPLGAAGVAGSIDTRLDVKFNVAPQVNLDF